MAKIPFWGHFSISEAISGPGAIFHFFPIFFGFWRRTGFPFCRWPPRTQQVSRKLAGWRSHVDALEGFVFLSSPCRKDQTKHNLGSKKTNKHKTHKQFSDGFCGTIVPGTNPHPSQGQTGQNGDFTVELNRERPVCPRDGSHFVPGRGPICPRDGSCFSRTPSRRKCLCLLVFFLPEQLCWDDVFKHPRTVA